LSHHNLREHTEKKKSQSDKKDWTAFSLSGREKKESCEAGFAGSNEGMEVTGGIEGGCSQGKVGSKKKGGIRKRN